jgi:hypothetical protein
MRCVYPYFSTSISSLPPTCIAPSSPNLFPRARPSSQQHTNTTSQALANGVLITRLKSLPRPPGAGSKGNHEVTQPALKVCLTTGLSKKEVEKAGITIRHAITKVVKGRK